MPADVCRVCGSPIPSHDLVRDLNFPHDVETIFDVVEQRLNAFHCEVCGARWLVLTPFAAVDQAARRGIVVRAGSDWYEAGSRKFPEDWSVEVVEDYTGLLGSLAAWLGPYVEDIFAAIQSSDYERLTRQDLIELYSPLFLRVLLGAAEGTIRLEGFMPGKERDFFLECTSGQLDRVGRESAKRGELLDLPAEIARRVPVPCLTPDLLASVARTCPQAPANPYDSPDQFTIGFRQEFLHAVACALAGQPNPRGEIWALYQFMVAVLAAQLPEGHVDAQLLLNERLGQLTLKFDDLWKVAWAEPMNGGRIEATADHLKLIFDMMGRLGFEGRFAVAVEAHQFVTSSQEIPPEIVIDTFSRSILSHCGFNQSLEDSRMIGHHVGLAIATFLRSSLDDVAIGLVQEMFSKAVDAGDDNAVLAIAAKSIEAFHSEFMYEEAMSVGQAAFDQVDITEAKTEPFVTVSFLNEIGNAFRYAGAHEQAHNCYYLAIELGTAAGLDEKTIQVARMNRAIVLRDEKRYDEALRALRELLERDPENTSIANSLVVALTELNRNREALDLLDAIIRRAPESPEAYLYLMNRAQARRLLGDDDQGIVDLIAADRTVPGGNGTARLLIASVAMLFHPTSAEGEDFVRSSEQQVLTALDEPDTVALRRVRLTALCFLCHRLIEGGRIAAAHEILDRHEPLTTHAGGNAGWYLAHLAALVADAEGRDDDAWSHVSEALRVMDETVPGGPDAVHALTWMQDKETVLRSLTRLTVGLVDAGIAPPDALVRVFEIANGREISAWRPGHASQHLERLREERAAYADGRPLEIFFFLVDEDSARLARISASAGWRVTLHDFRIGLAELRSLCRKVSASFRRANPANLAALDRQLESWDRFARVLGAEITAAAGDDAHVVFMPGTEFSGLPLHLLTAPDGSALIQAHTVSFAPNLATLTSTRRTPQVSKAAVVSVPKASDPASFAAGNQALAQRIAEALTGNGTETTLLTGVHATREEILGALVEADEAVLLCHGTMAGADVGRGLCVASQGVLPPSVLPVDDVPRLREFVLSWHDLVSLPARPRVLVTNGCSAGQTTVASGGVRLGFEQLLGPDEPTTVIAPLWDIERKASLTWIGNFCTARLRNPGWPPERAFQFATMRTKEAYSHPFNWAAFVMTGPLGVTSG
jgi:tetratricopeptide (TPR) repeat protein/CHAT domain-containing protein